MSEEIEIIIEASGKTSFKVKGVPGKKCVSLTQEIETLLGSLQNRKLTSDYFRVPLQGEIHTLVSREFSGRDENDG
jgi:hypothetical protein